MINPCRYNPVSGKINYLEKIKIHIITEPSTNSISTIQSKNPTSTILSIIDNKESYTVNQSNLNRPSDAYDYLIITSDNYQSNFIDFIEFNKRRCLKTEIALIEDIEFSFTGEDLQEKIRNFITQEYNEKGISFVLLGGDDEIIPHRGFRSEIMDYGTDYYDEQDIPASKLLLEYSLGKPTETKDITINEIQPLFPDEL